MYVLSNNPLGLKVWNTFRIGEGVAQAFQRIMELPDMSDVRQG